MSAQHTPGPWEIGISTSGHRTIFSDFCDGNTDIASPVGLQDCGGEDWTAIGEEEAQANIRLICAAPDLLVALKQCIPLVAAHANATFGDGVLALQVAKAAIAKAKGGA
jgi:hypothetical protein